MIIDFHTHVFEYSWLPQRWWSWLTGYYNSRDRNPLASNKKADDVIEELCDHDGSKLLSMMENANIDKSVVLPLDWGLFLGEPNIPIEEQHRMIFQISLKNNGKIIPFAGIDPRRKNANELIKFCLEEYKMQGIKLYPAAGYDLKDDIYSPIFRTALDYNVPVLIHTGYSFGPFLSNYGDPSVLDYLCAKYLEVTFIAAHLGAGYLEQLCWLGYTKTNLYADCSLMQIRARQNYSEFAKNIRLACDLFGSRRILFGSDWPFSQKVMQNGMYLDTFRKLTSIDGAETKLANYEVKQILGKNAEYLLSKKRRR
jgi:uncharacterized protein